MAMKSESREILLEQALLDLMHGQAALAPIGNTHTLQAFTTKEGALYRDVVDALSNLVEHVARDTGRERLAS